MPDLPLALSPSSSPTLRSARLVANGCSRGLPVWMCRGSSRVALPMRMTLLTPRILRSSKWDVRTGRIMDEQRRTGLMRLAPA